MLWGADWGLRSDPVPDLEPQAGQAITDDAPTQADGYGDFDLLCLDVWTVFPRRILAILLCQIDSTVHPHQKKHTKKTTKKRRGRCRLRTIADASKAAYDMKITNILGTLPGGI